MAKALKERDLQKYLIHQWEAGGGWAQNIHPGFGMKSGIPDVAFLVDGGLKLIELKVGSYETKTLGGLYIRVRNIRPLQRSWAIKFRRFGGHSTNIIGIPHNGGWDLYTLSHSQFISGLESFSELNVDEHEGPMEAIYDC